MGHIIKILTKPEIIKTRNVWKLDIEINNERYYIRCDENEAGYEYYILNDSIGFWIDIYDIHDTELLKTLLIIANNMFSDSFKNGIIEFDITDFDKII